MADLGRVPGGLRDLPRAGANPFDGRGGRDRLEDLAFAIRGGEEERVRIGQQRAHDVIILPRRAARVRRRTTDYEPRSPARGIRESEASGQRGAPATGVFRLAPRSDDSTMTGPRPGDLG